MSEIRSSGVHPVSGLQALVEDDGSSVWLYLRDPRASRIIADCWLYNRISIARGALANWPHDQPPPAPDDVVGPDATWNTSLPAAPAFTWSSNGRSVAIAIGGATIGYIASGARRGCSRYLKASGPWGAPFDAAEYARLFGGAAE